MMHEYVTTWKDYVAAIRLAPRRNRWSAARHFVFYRLLPVYDVVILLLLAYDQWVHRIGAHGMLSSGFVDFLILYTAFISICILVATPIAMRVQFKRLRNGRPAGASTLVGFEGDELVGRIPDRSEGRFRSSAIHDFLENDVIALLYVTRRMFLIVPKRAMPEDEWQRLRAWLGPLGERGKR